MSSLLCIDWHCRSMDELQGKPAVTNQSCSLLQLQGEEPFLPALKELMASYDGELVCCKGKYGHFEGVEPPSFHAQHFDDSAEEGSEQSQAEDVGGLPGSYLADDSFEDCHKLFEGPIFQAYNPVFSWENEKALIPGLRVPVSPQMSRSKAFTFSVDIVNLTVQAGLVEPFSGTICLYHKERREKISEDFHFSFSPEGWVQHPLDQQRKVLFTVDKPSPTVCLLVQVERTATEEGGLKPSVYSKNDVTSLPERDAVRGAAWAATCPFKEPLAWTLLPIFDKAVTKGLGGFGLDTSSPGTPSLSGRSTPRKSLEVARHSPYTPTRSSQDGAANALSFTGTPPRAGGAEAASASQAVQVDVPMFHRVKASYTDDSLHDQKKPQKPFRASMKLLIEKLSGRAKGSSASNQASESGDATPPRLPVGFASRFQPHKSALAEVQNGEDLTGGQVPSKAEAVSIEAESSGELSEAESCHEGMQTKETDRRESNDAVLDGPESGGSTPKSGNEVEEVLKTLPANRTHLNSGFLEVHRSSRKRKNSETPLGFGSTEWHDRTDRTSLDTEDWSSVVGRPDEEPLASTSGRGLESSRLLREPVRALDFRSLEKSEPYNELVHLLYVYPLSLQTPKKANVCVRVELRDDDSQPHNQPLQAVFPKHSGGEMLPSATTQVAFNSKTSLFHDEIKLRLPTAFLPQHHLLFTFVQPSLKPNEKSKILGYSVLPLSMSTQVLRSDGTLPIAKELLPMYLNESVKSEMRYLDDGRPLFRLRLRLCSTIHPTNERLQAFLAEYDNYMISGSNNPSSALLSAINHLRSMDFVTLQQYLHPTLTMLLRLVGEGGETLQVASFRALVNLLTRIQQESVDGSERNRTLVHYIDYAFDDSKDGMHSVYPGLCSVWRSLARSKAKGYKVGPVYEDVLGMAWVFLELIAKSIALEASKSSPVQEETAVPLDPDVFSCVRSLFDCLLSEVAEKARSAPPQARRLNTCLGYFCHELLAVIDPAQVYELVASCLARNTGGLHELKLSFLHVCCDYEKYLQLPGRTRDESNYLASTVVQQVLQGVAHQDSLIRTKAVRLLSFIMCKHEFDVQSHTPGFRTYAALLYLPVLEQVLEQPSLITDLAPSDQRELLVCVLTLFESLENTRVRDLLAAKEDRPRALFQVLDLALHLFQWGKEQEGAKSVGLYSQKLSPSVQHYVVSAIRQHEKMALEQSYVRQGIAHKANLREALAHIQASRKVPREQPSREELPHFLRAKLVLWEGNLCALIGARVLGAMRLFSDHCTPQTQTLLFPTLVAFLAKPQSTSVWPLFIPFYGAFLEVHGRAFLAPENGRFVKETAFHLLRLMMGSLKAVRSRAATCLFLLLRCIYQQQGSLRSTLTLLSLTLSELLSSIQVLDSYSAPPTEPPPKSLDQVIRLRGLLEDLSSRERCEILVVRAGMPRELISDLEPARTPGAATRTKGKRLSLRTDFDVHLPTVEAFEAELTPTKDTSARFSKTLAICEPVSEEPSPATPSDLTAEDSFFSISDFDSWADVSRLMLTLIRALDSSVQHSLQVSQAATWHDPSESYARMAGAYSHVLDLRTLWLLNLCEYHQEKQAWAEAAQCALKIAGSVMQELVYRGNNVWTPADVSRIQRLCPSLSQELDDSESASNKISVDTTIRYLQMAHTFASKAGLFQACTALVELQLPAYKSRGDHKQLAKAHESLRESYEAIWKQERNPSFKDANYYRVGFYGSVFGELDQTEFVYKESDAVRLGDMIERLSANRDQTRIGIVSDPRVVQNLPGNMAYLQITALEPLQTDSHAPRYMGVSEFFFDTGFVKEGQTPGGLETQWIRRTRVRVQGAFPCLVKRLPVVSTAVSEIAPVENAVALVGARSRALRAEMDQPQPVLSSIQRLLQGSVALQVHSGVLGVCKAFLAPKTGVAERGSAHDPELEKLKGAVLEFVTVCKAAVKVHAKLMGEDDQEFHVQLIQGLQGLIFEVSAFIPTVLNQM